MSAATPMQVRQWSEAVAADPASLAFLPLATAYRDQGRHDAALKLCIRGLEKHPDHVEAHYLLGLLYREGGEGLKAFDEWDIALALDPEHAGSRREIGLIAYARGDHAIAVRHLERSLANDAFDQEVRTALEDAWSKAKSGGSSSPASARPAPPPPAPAPRRTEPAPERVETTAVAAPISPSPSPATVAAPAAASEDGTHFDAAAREFEALSAERGIVGAVLLDDQGFVLAGQMVVAGVDRGAEVAAILSGASSEAGRALTHLGLGAWKGILVETPEAVVRLAPAGDGMIAVAGRREVPTGWTLRVAGRARDAALRFLGAGRRGVSAYGEMLHRINRIRNGVRGSMVVAADDGLIVEEDLMVGVPGPAAAALVASLFRRARRSVQAAEFGSASYLQVEGEEGLLFAAAPPQLGDLLLVVIAESWVNVGLVRLEAQRVVEALG